MSNKTFGPEITARAFKENTQHIVSDPFNAVIEIISNSWDAGAEDITITWPDDRGGEVIIEDNGEGMTEKEFIAIYPKMSYNRLKSKGKEVHFKRKRNGYREAYGKHGKGRFAPFCFANSFIIETWSHGTNSKFKVKRDKETGFVIEQLESCPQDDSGTKIIFKLNENYRDSKKIKKEIGTRFLTDPMFNITLNGKKIEFDDLKENLDEIPCKVDNKPVKILKIKSDQKSKNTHFRGVTWILGKRRIKTTTWNKILDGRIEEAKQYAYVVHSDILKDELNETMRDFSRSDNSLRIQNKIIKCIKKSVSKIMAHERNEIKKSIIQENISLIKDMSGIDQDEVGEFISELQETRTVIRTTDLKAATKAFIKIKKSKNSSKLFQQLSKLTIEDCNDLSKIFDEWTIKEARVVLSLIRSRLDLIEKLESKCNNPNTKELEELQPLFEEGLWIFGPEYESVEFTSNKGLTTVAISLLKKKHIKIKTSRLRPDFVVLPDSTISMHSCDKFNEDGESEGIEKILFIELKRGGSQIDVTERSQVENYINILINGGAILKGTKIDAYVVGSTVLCDKIEIGELKDKKIIPITYHSILKKAERRLMNLRKKIEEEKNIRDEATDPTVKESLLQATIEDYK